jgi:hypothetical protein
MYEFPTKYTSITNSNARYLNHLLNTRHAYGSIMDTINYENREKGKASKHIREMPST